MSTTVLSDLIDPEVMADSISADLPAKLRAKGFYKVDTTLASRPGDTITLPRFNYIGPAADLAEGVEGSVDKLTTNQAKYTVKKAVKNVELTDEAILSGHGDPVGETNKQLRMSIQDKVDTDGMTLLDTDTGIYRIVTSGVLSYDVVAEAMSVFADEEQGQETYILVSQEGMKQLRADSKLLGNEMLAADMLSRGVVGIIAGANIIISNKLNGTNDTRKAFLLKRGALTAFLKRDINLETQRNVLSKKTLFSADEHYFVGIEDENKLVGVTHVNSYLGQLQLNISTDAASATTYNVTLNSTYPTKFSVNTLWYKSVTTFSGVTYNQAITASGGWTTVSGNSFTASGVANSNSILLVVQALTADGKAKYFGSGKLV